MVSSIPPPRQHSPHFPFILSLSSSLTSIIIVHGSLIFVNDSWSSLDDELLNKFGTPIAFHLESEGFVTEQKKFREEGVR